MKHPYSRNFAKNRNKLSNKYTNTETRNFDIFEIFNRVHNMAKALIGKNSTRKPRHDVRCV